MLWGVWHLLGAAPELVNTHTVAGIMLIFINGIGDFSLDTIPLAL